MPLQEEKKIGKNIIKPGYCGRVAHPEKSDNLSSMVKDRLKATLRPIYRPLRHFAISTLCRLRRDYKGIIYVDPQEIKNTVNTCDSTLKQNGMWHFGTVKGGDWDLGGAPIKKYGNIYFILKQHTELGRAYDDIPEFKENLKRIAQGERPDNCSSEKMYREKWNRIETIFNLLKKEGYKSQKELESGFPFNEIRVQVGRHGDLLFEEGMHRLAICQLLRFEKIPVILTRRHAQWVKKNGQQVYKNFSPPPNPDKE